MRTADPVSMTTTSNERLMAEASAVCRKGIEAGQAPFGAVIGTPDGAVTYAAHNTVRLDGDPTAHAEINVIRGACAKLKTIDLSGHIMATTCEPCPMCAAAIHWAKLERVLYGASIEDAERAGFSELRFACKSMYETGGSKVRVEGGILRSECVDLFRLWQSGPHADPY